MVVQLKDIMSVSDIISTHRYELSFGNIPSGPTLKAPVNAGKNLLIKTETVTFPPIGAVAVRANILGYTRMFRGGRDNGNELQTTIYEDSNGDTVASLLAWSDAACSFEGGDSGFQSEYSRQCELSVYDSTGSRSLIFGLTSMWPTAITIPAGTAESAAAIVQASFAFDFIDLLGAGDSAGVHKATYAPYAGGGGFSYQSTPSGSKAMNNTLASFGVESAANFFKGASPITSVTKYLTAPISNIGVTALRSILRI